MYFLAVEQDPVDKIVALLLLVFFCASCSTTPRKPAIEPLGQQADAAQKVMGALVGHEVSPNEFKRVVDDVQKNEGSRSAVQKIIGADSPVVIKYSPVTGKHYSGDLEFDPETGARLEVLPE